MTSLKDIVNLLSNNDVATLRSSPDTVNIVYSYLKDIDTVGMTALQSLDGVSLSAIISILQSSVVEDFLARGELTSNEAQFLLSRKFSGMVTTLFKLSVGIAALEEYR